MNVSDARVLVTGGSGFMEAQTFNIQGNFASYQGTGPFQGSSLTTVTTTDPDTTVVNTTVTGATTNYGTSTDNSTTVSGQTRPIFTSPGTPSTPASTQTTGTGSGLGE